MPTVQKITPCLWFESQAEEAAKMYVSIFNNSKITKITRYSEAGKEFHGKEPGSVLTVTFQLDGQEFTILNGGPMFKLSEAMSLQIHCDDQREVDYFWEKLGAGGDPNAQNCGWLKDKFGLSWQIIPKGMIELISDHTSEKAIRAMNAMFTMKKLDIDAMRKAYDGV